MLNCQMAMCENQKFVQSTLMKNSTFQNMHPKRMVTESDGNNSARSYIQSNRIIRTNMSFDKTSQDLPYLNQRLQKKSHTSFALHQSYNKSSGFIKSNQISKQNKPIGSIGWGVSQYPDKNQRHQIPKKCTYSFDNKKQQQFVYQQDGQTPDGFSRALDKKMGFQYSSKFSIKQMREEIMGIMKVKNKGHYSQYTAGRANSSMDTTQREFLLHVQRPQAADTNLDGGIDFIPNKGGMQMKTNASIQDIKQFKFKASDLESKTHDDRKQKEKIKNHMKKQKPYTPLKIFNDGSDFDYGDSYQQSTQSTKRSGIQRVQTNMSSQRRLQQFQMIAEDAQCPKFKHLKNKQIQEYKGRLVLASKLHSKLQSNKKSKPNQTSIMMPSADMKIGHFRSTAQHHRHSIQNSSNGRMSKNSTFLNIPVPVIKESEVIKTNLKYSSQEGLETDEVHIE